MQKAYIHNMRAECGSLSLVNAFESDGLIVTASLLQMISWVGSDVPQTYDSVSKDGTALGLFKPSVFWVTSTQ
jgi:hypothetical protein